MRGYGSRAYAATRHPRNGFSRELKNYQGGVAPHFKLAKHHETLLLYVALYLITKYHCVRENTAYSKDFI